MTNAQKVLEKRIRKEIKEAADRGEMEVLIKGNPDTFPFEISPIYAKLRNEHYHVAMRGADTLRVSWSIL